MNAAKRWRQLGKNLTLMGGNPVLVVIADDSCLRGWGSNPGAVYWMDIFSH